MQTLFVNDKNISRKLFAVYYILKMFQTVIFINRELNLSTDLESRISIIS